MTNDQTAAGGRPAEPCNWGRFGPADQLGTLNFLTADAVLRGVRAVVTGERIPLNLPLDQPAAVDSPHPMFKPGIAAMRRESFRVNAMTKSGLVANDDVVSFATQGSSQWDSLIHIGLAEPGVDGAFYNGVPYSAVTAEGYATRNGIDNVAKVGIAGRGILVDIARWRADGADDPLPLAYVCSVEETLQCLEDQGTQLFPGDIVCFRTGWAERYLDATPDERRRLGLGPDHAFPPSPGISPDHAQLAYDHDWAALVGDNPGVEALPLADPSDSGHIRMLRNLGLPLGELFDLRALGQACAADQRWEFLFVAVPLWVPGGAGSPANAIAIR